MDAAEPVRLPKFQALVDWGRGLYKGFDIHSHDLAQAVERTKNGFLILADGLKYEIQNGAVTNPQPHPSRADLRFVWFYVP